MVENKTQDTEWSSRETQDMASGEETNKMSNSIMQKGGIIVTPEMRTIEQRDTKGEVCVVVEKEIKGRNTECTIQS